MKTLLTILIPLLTSLVTIISCSDTIANTEKLKAEVIYYPAPEIVDRDTPSWQDKRRIANKGKSIVRMETSSVMDFYQGPNDSLNFVRNAYCQQVFLLLLDGYDKDSKEVKAFCDRYKDKKWGYGPECPYCI